ncbi:hypothetical protein [Gemmata palustris]|nr:hypothetical protein [Gemmata palustris]
MSVAKIYRDTRYFLYPSDKIDSIKERLIAQGLIKLQSEAIAA